ncbi:MAG: hypothetical protein ACYDGM_06185 [Vulcanimicrobiaceae bacterium]
MQALRPLLLTLLAIVATVAGAAAALGAWHFSTSYGELTVTRIPAYARSAPEVQPSGVTLRAASRPIPGDPSRSATDSWQIAYRTTVSRKTTPRAILAPLANEEVAAQVSSRMRILQYGTTKVCGKPAAFYTVTADAGQFGTRVYSVRVIAIFDTQAWESTLNMIDRPAYHLAGALPKLLHVAQSFCVQPK